MIDAPCEQAFSWLMSLEQAYADWHPDHISCRALKGSIDEVGSEFECKEYLHGKLHTMRFRVTEVIPNRRMAYTISGMGRGSFEFIPREEGIEFLAEVSFGSELPLIGRSVDWILNRFFKSRLDAMKMHMFEEGRNLKRILETERRL